MLKVINLVEDQQEEGHWLVRLNTAL